MPLLKQAVEPSGLVGITNSSSYVITSLKKLIGNMAGNVAVDASDQDKGFFRNNQIGGQIGGRHLLILWARRFSVLGAL